MKEGDNFVRTIKYFIDKQGEDQPDKVYLFAPEPGLEITYSQLKAESEKLGRYLINMGLVKGDKVSYMLNNGYQTAKLFLGVMYAGLVISPVNLLAHPSQLEYVLSHSDTKIVFVSEKHRERLKEALKKVPREIKVFVIDVDGPVLLEREEGGDLRLPEVEEDDPALLLYTSGTTGVPKGVVLTHKNLVAGGQYTAMAHMLTSDDRALCSLPLYHINGLVVTTVSPVVHGGSVVMPHRFSVTQFWELISEYRCTWFSVVPTMISYLLNGTDPYNSENKYNLEQIRFGRSASSALPPSIHKAFEEKFRVAVVETMGLTETAAPVFSNPLEKSMQKYGSPGVAMGNSAMVVDSDGCELPPGQIGEILIKGDNVMKEYYKAPDITAKTIRNGWLHTGDLGYKDKDGYFFITGRIKELIIKGGENIAPREIDEVLYKYHKVLDAAAFGVPDEAYGQEIYASVVLKPGEKCTEEEILSFCLKELGKFKSPKKVLFRDELPKGPSGKIQRLKIAEKEIAALKIS